MPSDKFMIKHVTLHPGGNSVDPVRSPCPVRPPV